LRRHVSHDIRRFARSMRNDPTEGEAAMWQLLRNRKLEGLRFRRQHPIGPYIVDFVCLDSRLIVEVDGSQHADSLSDRHRDAYLERLGFRVVRFWNDDVLKYSDGVADMILFCAGKC
jgi:very-short-patch-repair endonuclease